MLSCLDYNNWSFTLATPFSTVVAAVSCVGWVVLSGPSGTAHLSVAWHVLASSAVSFKSVAFKLVSFILVS